MLRLFKTGAAWAALIVALAIPVGVMAQQAGMPTLSLMATSGAFGGKWVYRSFDISSDPKQTLAKLALGQSELALTEASGQVSGTRTGQGVTYQLSGQALYAPKQGATIRLHGTAEISGKTFNYDYFGYMIPSWSLGAGIPDTILGTVLKSDPTGATPPVIASFSAVKEP